MAALGTTDGGPCLLLSCAGLERAAFANSLRERLLLGSNAVALADFSTGAQFENARQGDPGFGISLRVVDLKREVYRVSIHALVTFFQTHGLTVGKARGAQPGAIVIAG